MKHVEGPTHKSGNCLNLIFTEEMSRAKAMGCSQNMFVSDHSSIQCVLDIPNGNCTWKVITYKKLKDVDISQLVKDMSLEEIKTEKLDEMVAMLEDNFSTALNNQAPEISKIITERKKKPWFGELSETTEKKSQEKGKGFREIAITIMLICIRHGKKEIQENVS